MSWAYLPCPSNTFLYSQQVQANWTGADLVSHGVQEAPQSPSKQIREGASPRGPQDTQQLWNRLYDSQSPEDSASPDKPGWQPPEDAPADTPGDQNSGSPLAYVREPGSTMQSTPTTVGTPLQRISGSVRQINRSQLSPDDISLRLLAIDGNGADSRLDIREKGEASEAEPLRPGGHPLGSLESITTASAASRRASPFASLQQLPSHNPFQVCCCLIHNRNVLMLKGQAIE